MATYTPNYNLKKPALNDKIRIADFNGNADIIDDAMNNNATLIAQLKSDIGIVENTNTATHNISAGQYVIWKGSLYTASSAISSGATLSDANLTAVSGGGLNALNSKITPQTISGVDLNNIKTTGTYLVNGNVTHSPYGNYGYMTVISAQIGCVQYFVNANPGDFYYRTYYESAWTSWKKVTATAV